MDFSRARGEGSKDPVGRLVLFQQIRFFTDQLIDEENNNIKCHYMKYVLMSEEPFSFAFTCACKPYDNKRKRYSITRFLLLEQLSLSKVLIHRTRSR